MGLAGSLLPVNALGDESKAKDAAPAAPKAAAPKAAAAEGGEPTAGEPKTDEPKAGEPKADPTAEIEPEVGEGVRRPEGSDERTGHVYIRVGSNLEIPSGYARSGVALVDVVGLGVGLDAAIGVGLSPHAELSLEGTYAWMLGASNCSDCGGDHVAASLGFVYHLARGTAFDPWMRLGMGYRTVEYVGGPGAPSSLIPGRFHGFDFTDISFGGTFFPVPAFGLGPFLAADVGAFLARPELAGSSGGTRVYAFFQTGLRFELDPVPRRAAPSRSTAALPSGSGSAAREDAITASSRSRY